MTKLTIASNSLATSKWRWWIRTPLARAKMDDDGLGQTSSLGSGGGQKLLLTSRIELPGLLQKLTGDYE